MVSDLVSRLTDVLRGDERVVWSGKPVKIAFIFSSLISIPSGIVLAAVAIVLLQLLSTLYRLATVVEFFAAFVVLFILIGIGIAFSPVIRSLLAYRNTEYVITDRRLITQTGAIGLDTRFVDLDKIQEVYVTIGIADRIFGTGSVRAVTAAGWIGTIRGIRYPLRPTLIALRKPYEVQKILQENIEKA